MEASNQERRDVDLAIKHTPKAYAASGMMDPAEQKLPFRFLVLDLTGVPFVDTAGAKLLASTRIDFKKIGVGVVYAGTTGEYSFHSLAVTQNLYLIFQRYQN